MAFNRKPYLRIRCVAAHAGKRDNGFFAVLLAKRKKHHPVGGRIIKHWHRFSKPRVKGLRDYFKHPFRALSP